MAVDPGPLSIDPTQAWEGNDGPWSTFFLGVGTPLQFFRVLVSLTVNQPWLILPEGCTVSDPPTCLSHRGPVFYRNRSTTWKDHGFYTLDFEQNLGIFENGAFGYDTLSTGLQGTHPITLDNQVIAGIATKSFYLNLWGIGPAPINLTSFNNPYPSMMTTLKERSLIPSISYGYTAGARYQLKQVAGSLTLGGYDASRFASHSTTFSFAGDISRDLIVSIQDIVISGNNGSTSFSSSSLLPHSILSFIDASVPQIWLPRTACDLFAQTFGLYYDPLTNLYLINETMHEIIQQKNITLTFKLSDISRDNANIISIDFPYAAFDLTLTTDYPNVNVTTRYFPIRRAANDTQYTLGRTFLQQAYIVADYERSNFSVYPCVFSEGLKQDLRGIPPLSNSSTNSTDNPEKSSVPRHSFVPGIIAAIAIGAIVAVFLVSIGAYVLGRRRDSLHWYMLRLKAIKRRRLDSRQTNFAKAEAELHQGQAEMEGDVVHRGELTGDTQMPAELIADLQRPEELSANVCHVPELESSATVQYESHEDVTRYELDAGTGFSYVQTPLSKLARPGGF